MKVAYLGPQGTFTEHAAKKLFPEAELAPLRRIRNVAMGVEDKHFDAGVVPVENIYEGDVSKTLDAIRKCEKTKIVSETSFQVVHCVGALYSHGRITKIYSKDQALNQCEEYLIEEYPKADFISVESTSHAAKYVAQEKMSDAAAIASREALKMAGLEVIAEDICPDNRTRFFGLARKMTGITGADKTLLSIHPLARDEPGLLHKVLGIFAALDINLDYIQSRPDRSKGYYFYTDIQGHAHDKKVMAAIDSVRLCLDPEEKHPDCVKVLGSYHNSEWKE